jgi:hypothetical protein
MPITVLQGYGTVLQGYGALLYEPREIALRSGL